MNAIFEYKMVSAGLNDNYIFRKRAKVVKDEDKWRVPNNRPHYALQFDVSIIFCEEMSRLEFRLDYV